MFRSSSQGSFSLIRTFGRPEVDDLGRIGDGEISGGSSPLHTLTQVCVSMYDYPSNLL